jgi:hypothetical protein
VARVAVAGQFVKVGMQHDWMIERSFYLRRHLRAGPPHWVCELHFELVVSMMTSNQLDDQQSTYGMLCAGCFPPHHIFSELRKV